MAYRHLGYRHIAIAALCFLLAHSWGTISPVRLFNSASFDSETTRLLAAAYEEACAQAGPDLSESVQELFAKRILQAASRGERDQQRLTACALGKERIPDTG
jgi:hypothetical protein